MAHVPALPPHCGSWVVVRRDTGAAILKTARRSIVERVNGDSYAVLTAADYLGRLNALIRKAGGVQLADLSALGA